MTTAPSRLRVLHVATASDWRGGEQQALYLLEGFQREGLDAVVATPGEGELARRARDRGMRVLPLSVRADGDFPSALRLRGYLREGFDILHLHTARAHAAGLLALLGVRGKPRVVVARRVDFPLKGGPAARLKYGNRVDRFVAVSREIARVLREGGVPETRIRVVHSGVDPDRLQVPGDARGLRGELGIPPEAPLVLFVGALVGHKAPFDLVTAVPALDPAAHVIFAGEGPLRAELATLAAAGGSLDRIHFLGHRDDVPRLLRSADVFCLPSRMEGLGTSVLDAMAAGIPVVGARAGGIPEMITHEESGLLAPPGDPAALAEALERVLTEPDLAARLTSGATRALPEFTAGRMVEKTLAVYEDVLGNAPGRVSRSAGPLG